MERHHEVDLRRPSGQRGNPQRGRPSDQRGNPQRGRTGGPRPCLRESSGGRSVDENALPGLHPSETLERKDGMSRKVQMKTRTVALPLLAVLALSVGTQAAVAKGCIKGAAVGAVAGHVAGHHAVLGAAAGCAIGHHAAKKKMQQEQQQRQQQNQPNPPQQPPSSIQGTTQV
jgi:hypothetical protein